MRAVSMNMLKKKILFLFVISMITFMANITIVDKAQARAVKKELPRPYYPRMGDGDTINRKFLHPGTLYGGFEYTGSERMCDTKYTIDHNSPRISKESLIKIGLLYHLIMH